MSDSGSTVVSAAVKGGRLAAMVYGLWRIARAAMLAPVFGTTAVLSGLLWLFVPGFVARRLWSWSRTPGTRLHRARERMLLGVARQARRRGV